MPAIERTHRFPRNQAIDCRDWREFTIVETTMRWWRIRYVADQPEEIDKQAEIDVE